MAAGDLITTDWEMEYNGLLMGGETDYNIRAISGLLDMPDIVSADQSRLRRHGLRAGDDFLQGRAVTITLEVYGSTAPLFASAVQALKLAFRPGQAEIPLVFQIPAICNGVKFQVNARPRRVSWPVNMEHFFRKPELVVEFYATDPRLYAAAVGQNSASLPTAGGGLSFNATPDFSFGATSTGGELTLTNNGTFSTPVVFRIHRPVQTPTLIHNGLGGELELGITVANGDFLVLDSASRTVLLNGTADRYYTLAADSVWFDLEPGDNYISFRGATTDVGSITATYRSAWV